MMTVAGKALGQRKALFADFSVPLPPSAKDGGAATLRDLIAHIVRAEVSAFHERQEDNRLLKALSSTQIADGLARGKVDMGGKALFQMVDEDQAVATALLAFEDGLYLTVLDEQECKSLDAQVYLKPDSRVTFVRLAMLAGG